MQKGLMMPIVQRRQLTCVHSQTTVGERDVPQALAVVLTQGWEI